MFLDATTVQALAIVGAVGAVAGLVGGFVASADNLIGTMLMGVIGAVSLSAIFRLANAPPVYAVGEFSAVWGALGGLVLGYVVGRSNV
ncbi:MAG: hypothetical protein L0Z49_08540 [Actinobacteria bacterium]|nr:hypothetical protein [Actinomycetota bacterium]MCI0544473.1 hypothetical protein [Actinomycetota bacterium]